MGLSGPIIIVVLVIVVLVVVVVVVVVAPLVRLFPDALPSQPGSADIHC